MLERLVVKNVALMDEAEVEFSDGLNILTGETGAGKSILIDSINLALGAKADKNLIRRGAEYAYVELVFSVRSEKVLQQLKEMEIFPEEDGKVILQRRIMPGKSSCRLNGETVSGKTLKEAASVLIDIHGQHEHQSLLNEKKHLEVLNLYCGQPLSSLMENTEKQRRNCSWQWRRTPQKTVRLHWRSLNSKRLRRRMSKKARTWNWRKSSAAWKTSRPSVSL